MEFFDFKVITGSLPEFWRGLWMTVQLTGLALLFGFFVAIPLAVMRLSPNRLVSAPVAAYTYFFRGTPMLVQLLLVYYGASQWEWMRAAWEAGHPLWSLFREPYFCALFAFGLNTCAYTVEILAGSMRNTPHGELEAAKAMGMTTVLTYTGRVTHWSATAEEANAYTWDVARAKIADVEPSAIY